MNLFVGPGTRIGLLGPNGCGKSTLLRVLLGEEPPSDGTVQRADGLQVAYFQQNRELLDPEATVADTLSPDGDHVTFRGARLHVRGYLERFLFRPEQAEMPVRQLSGGEQSRLLLAKLMLRDAQILVLDEPTNDLDLATLAILEESLTSFDGAVLLVTHDRYFLDQVATTILAFAPEGAVVPFASVAQWETWRAEAAAAQRQRDMPSRESKPASRKKLSYMEQREYDGIEQSIAAADAALAQAKADAGDPINASNAARLIELFAAVETKQADVDRLYARWSELEAKLTKTD